jgi:putative DNA primase/helicase
MSTARHEIPPEMLREVGLEPKPQDVYDVYDVYDLSRELPLAPEFPVDAMPAGCRTLIREASDAIGCPPEFVALPMLAVLATAIGNSRVVELKPGWEEKAVIFVTVIGDPAAKKSPGAKVATKPAKRLQVELRNVYQAKREDYERDMLEYEKDKRELRKAGAADPRPPKEPVMERTAVDDTTVEALTRVLKESPRGVLVAKDELAGWIRGMDQYKAGGKGSDRQFWLSAWNSDPITVDRKGAPEALMVSEPFVGISGGIQPEVLKDLSRGPEDGMLDRFLCAFPEPVAPGWREAHITEAAELRYAKLYKQLRMRHLDTDEFGDPLPQKLVFSPSAKAVLIDAINGHAREMCRPGFPASLKGAFGKLEAYIGRLCLVLAMARAVEEKAPEQVEPRDVVAAMALIDYFKQMARRVHAALRDSDPLDGLAEDLARFLELQGSEWSGEPSELYSQLKSHHKPTRVNEFGKMVRAAVKRQARLTFDDGHERVIKPDGTASTRRVMELKLIETS